MSKIFYLIFLFIITSECSFNKNSKFWTSSQKIKAEKNNSYKKLFSKEKTLKKELNQSLKLSFSLGKDEKISKNYNNLGMINFDKPLKKTSRYKFSRIKNFYQFEPVISHNDGELIFFDNKGSILKFDKKSKLKWKKIIIASKIKN